MTDTSINRPKAPDFPEGFAWFNSDRPLSLKGDLKGRVVVVDFWTYCCINCLHILPHLAIVEERFRDEPVVVIGVHSAKFDNESIKSNIREAILRHGVHHPVVVDENRRVWSEFGARAWPTLAFIDAEGRLAGMISGESKADRIAGVVSRLLEEGRQKGVLAEGPPALKAEEMVPSTTGLAYPGKTLVDEKHDRVFISDSGRHRIIQTDRNGRVQALYGAGSQGFADGPADLALFNNPQGLAVDTEARLLYVADTDNCAIREISLSSGHVRTIAGTGVQVFDRFGGGPGAEQGLNSPWDLVLHNKRLYIAMAGGHQIWVYDFASGRARAWAGSGNENIVDGPLDGAALAQPSGLSLDGGRLYIADSEVSAARFVDMDKEVIGTLIGHGLFEFGDLDGPFRKARLQHPLDVAARGDSVYVADTYNHKIKRLDLKTQTITTILGTGRPPAVAGPDNPLSSLYEPGGLSLGDKNLYIADTNNHRILIHRLDSSRTVEFQIDWSRWNVKDEDEAPLPITSARLGLAGKAELAVSLDLPEGYKLNGEAPICLRFDCLAPADGYGPLDLDEAQSVPLVLSSGVCALKGVVALRDRPMTGVYDLTVDLVLCSLGDAQVCAPASARWQLEVDTVRTESRATIDLAGTIPAPDLG